MRILLIGGTGNISAPITQALIDRGDDVTLYHTGKSPSGRQFACHHLFGDRSDLAKFESQVQEAGVFDCVIDMICYAPREEESDVRAFSGRTGQFIFCSTVDVYPKPAARYPVRQGIPLGANPAFEYAYQKVLCEQIFAAAPNLNTTVIRPAATYNDTWAPIAMIGSGVSLLKRIRQGQPVMVPGNGQSIWVSAHRDDVARCFVAALGNHKTYGRAYHVTGEEWMTWEGYYLTAARVLQAPSIEFVHIPANLLARMTPQASWTAWNFQYDNLYDNQAACADLGYRYTISWEEGLRRMVAYHDGLGNIDQASDDPLYDKVIATWRSVESRAVAEMGVDGN